MKADPRILADLNLACGALATMVEQFRIDRVQLKTLDCEWLAGKYGKWYEKAEEHLCSFQCRLIAFEGEPSFSIAGPKGGGGDVAALLQRNLDFAQKTFDQFCAARAKAYTIRADYTPDDYEHAIKFLEKLIVKHETQLRLISGLTQPGYIGARLEDG